MDDKKDEKIFCVTVTCRDMHGIDEDKTFCIDFFDNRLVNNYLGSKISYGYDFLKIGRCKIPIEDHNLFPGSWCAEDFYVKKSNLVKLFRHLKKTGRWFLEDYSDKFGSFWEKLKVT